MIIKIEELKKICCNKQYIDSLMKQSEDKQKEEFGKLEAIKQYYLFYRHHFQALFFEECIMFLKDKGGMKEDFLNAISKAEEIIDKIALFMEEDFEVEDVSCHLCNFEPGEDGDLYGLYYEQYYWEDESMQ